MIPVLIVAALKYGPGIAALIYSGFLHIKTHRNAKAIAKLSPQPPKGVVQG